MEGKKERFSQSYKKRANTPKNALLCQNARTETTENTVQPKYKEGGKKEVFFQKLRNLNEENVTLQNMFCLKEFCLFDLKANVS